MQRIFALKSLESPFEMKLLFQRLKFKLIKTCNHRNTMQTNSACILQAIENFTALLDTDLPMKLHTDIRCYKKDNKFGQTIWWVCVSVWLILMRTELHHHLDHEKDHSDIRTHVLWNHWKSALRARNKSWSIRLDWWRKTAFIRGITFIAMNCRPPHITAEQLSPTEWFTGLFKTL